MEDILASIKRIIAEDSEAVGARAPRLRREQMAAVSASPLVTSPTPVEPEPEPEMAAEQPVFEETPGGASPVEAPEAITPTAPEPVAATADAPDVLELTSPMPEAATAKPQDVPAGESPAVPSAMATDGLLSSISAQASRNAFAALSQMQVRAEDGQSNTLEGLVAELLKPMLREWLDRELPALVERLVSAEVSRLSGRG